ncbi:MAG: HlyD family efflux transporter periplasmic adaptor subunit [Prevotella sp.]|nr:HlyD family efflux transporter periplasmic adaptor subunit [Prevotella sp.]
MKTYQLFLMAIAGMAVVACGEKDVDYDASGVFETTEVIVSAKSAGEITSFTVEEGQNILAGTVLGSIDANQLKLKKTQLDASKAQLNANKKQLGASKTAANSHVLDLEKQVASIKQQISNAQKEKARFQSLLKDGAATRKQVDDIGYQISVLQAQLAATQEQIASSNRSFSSQSAGIDAQIQGVDAQNAGVDAQQAQIDDQISNTYIKSPITGIVLAKYAEQGEYAVPGKALFKISDVNDMKLRAYITADQLTDIKLGQKVTVFADQRKSGRKEYQGTVTWISDKAEFTPKTIQTRDERANLVYAIKVSVKNDGLIKRGMYGDIKF